MLGQHLPDHPGTDLLDRTDGQGAELERTIGKADQPVHGQAEMLQHLADLPVLALGDGDADPQVGGGVPLAVLGLVQRRLDRAVVDSVDRDAVLQRIQLQLTDAAAGAGAVLTHQLRRGQFERAAQFAVIGQQQQSFGVEVEPAH